MPPQLSLKETLFALKDSLHSLDIRAAVKLGDSDWLCLLTVIRISARSVEEVAQHHRRLESKCDRPDAGDFRILLEALPFSHIDSWLTRLSEASLLVNGFQVRLPQPVAEETLRGSVNRYDNFLIPSEGKESPHIDFYSGTRSISFQDLAVIRTAYSMGWPSAEAAATFFLGLKENEVGRSSVSIYFQIEMPAIIEIGTTDHESMKLQVTAEKCSSFDSCSRTVLLSCRDISSIL